MAALSSSALARCTPLMNTEVVLIKIIINSALFSVKLPCWDLAWMLWQIFLAMFVLKSLGKI
jgi:hypothetical protein